MQNWTFTGVGTLINTIAVLAGSMIGLVVGNALPERIQEVAVFGIGLITICLGVQMFLRTKNPLVVVGAICIGGVFGAIVGLDVGLDRLANWMRHSVGGDGRFNQGFVTASVLFCIGPMTLMGCLQDALEKKIELLGLKSLLDGLSSVFLAATLGVGVLFSALFVLIFQGLLTLLAKGLSKFAQDGDLIGETVACGGIIMVAIGFGITGIRSFPTVLLLPALALAPLFGLVSKRLIGDKKRES